MVKGIDTFRDYFAEYTDQYVLIGGAACDQLHVTDGELKNLKIYGVHEADIKALLTRKYNL